MQQSPHASLPIGQISAGLLILIGLAIFLGPTLIGMRWATTEGARLRKSGANPNHINPANKVDFFSATELAPDWSHIIINGQGKQIPFMNYGYLTFDGLSHHVTSLHALPGGGLAITQERDPDFRGDRLPIWESYFGNHYNNAAIVGMAGFQPIPGQDIVLEVDMQASPSFYGSAGAAFEPQGTLTPDGNFKDGIFTMFGVSFLGPNSSLRGQRNLIASLNLNWWPEQAQELPNVDIAARHTYTIRVRWVSETEWLGLISVDGRELSQMSMPPLGPLEVQIWGDNYLLRGGNPWLAPTVTQENGNTKSVFFYRVSIKTEKRND